VEEGLRRLSGSDRVAYEQIVDVMVWRRFRDSILCRSGRTVADTVDRTLLTRLRFRTAGPLSGFGGETDPVLEALASLTPPPVAFEELRRHTDLGTEELVDALFDAARRGRVTMHLDPPRHTRADAERPRISALARLQAVDQQYCTTLLGGVVQPQGPVVRALIQFADGSRDREQLRTALVDAGGPRLEPEQLETALQEFAALALVEGG
jgi:hypothetical protein